MREDKSVLKVRTQNFNTFSYRLVSLNNYFLHQEIQRLDETKLSQESMVPDHLFSKANPLLESIPVFTFLKHERRQTCLVGILLAPTAWQLTRPHAPCGT